MGKSTINDFQDDFRHDFQSIFCCHVFPGTFRMQEIVGRPGTPDDDHGTRDPYLKLRPNHVGWHRRVNLVFLLYSTTFPVHSHHIQPSIHSQLPEAMWLVRGWFLPALRPSWMNLRLETYENRGSTVKLTLKHLKKHLKIPWVEVTQSLKWLKYVKIC